MRDLSTGFNDPTTTRGDVIYRGASAPSRLAVGAAGKLLGSDGTDPAWVGGKLGAYVYRTSDKSSTGGGAPDTIDWDAEAEDNGGFHSNVTNNSRLTVPSGADGLYIVGYGQYVSVDSGSWRLARISKNGTAIRDDWRAKIGTALPQGFSSFLIRLAAADYMEIGLAHDGTSGTWTCGDPSAASGRCFFGMALLVAQ